MNYKRKWLNSVKVIKKHKSIFLFLIFFQLVFIASSVFYFLHFQNLIINDFTAIMEPFQEQVISPDDLNFDKLILLNSRVESIKNNVFNLTIVLSLLFIIVNGPIWMGTHYLFDKWIGFKRLGLQWLKFTVIYLLFIACLSLTVHLIIKYLIKNQIESVDGIYIGIFGLYLILFYFQSVGFALIKMDSWKKFLVLFLKKSFSMSTLFLALICLIPVIISLALLYYTIISASFLITATILFTVMIVIVRIYWIAGLQIEKDNP